VPEKRALTAESFGAWLLKANPAGGAIEEHARTGFESVRTRCVRPSYRTELVTAGQPVLLWVSGRDPRHPPGLHAAGRTTGVVTDSVDGPVMHVQLTALSPIVPRAALVEDPVLASLEVLRMPAGSNPSWLDRAQYDALCAGFPQVDRPARPDHGNA
jgi:hypothetical protein